MIHNISVIGTGYLGVTHAVCLAELGHDVIGIDADPGKVARLAAGRPKHAALAGRNGTPAETAD